MLAGLKSLAAYAETDLVVTGGDRLGDSKLGAGARSTHVAAEGELHGTAADIKSPAMTHLQLANRALESRFFNGVGWYQEGVRGPNGEGPHVHVDLGPLSGSGGIRQWGYFAPYTPVPRSVIPPDRP